MIAAREGRIVYAGRAADAPTGLEAKERIDCGERWITPGLIDCHTHLVYGGNRAISQRPVDLLHDGAVLVRQSSCICLSHLHPLQYALLI